MDLMQAMQDNSVSGYSPPVFFHFKAPRLAAETYPIFTP
jgi:hypothetical protein